jgi:hypothetical protein
MAQILKVSPNFIRELASDKKLQNTIMKQIYIDFVQKIEQMQCVMLNDGDTVAFISKMEFKVTMEAGK